MSASKQAWEYRRTVIELHAIDTVLNYQGMDGWELVAIPWIQIDSGVQQLGRTNGQVMLVFKRPVVISEDGNNRLTTLGPGRPSAATELERYAPPALAPGPNS